MYVAYQRRLPRHHAPARASFRFFLLRAPGSRGQRRWPVWAEHRSALHDRALMTSFEDRAGADRVEELLAKAAEAKGPLAMSVVNWGEVYYSVWRARTGISS